MLSTIIKAALVAFLLFTPGCASGIDGARQAMAAAAETTKAAMEAFTKYDGEHQKLIVLQHMPDQLAAAQALLEYRAERAKFVKVVLEVKATVAAGAVLIPLVEAGVRKQTDLTLWMIQLGDAVVKLKDAMKLFGLVPPGALFNPPEPQDPAERDSPSPPQSPAPHKGQPA